LVNRTGFWTPEVISLAGELGRGLGDLGKIKSNQIVNTMKSYYPFRSIVPILAASLLLVSALSASAQEGKGRRGGGGLPNATEAQTAALQQMREETRDITQKLTQARTELNNAIFAAKVDEAAIKAKAAALAKIEEEEAVARAKAFAKVRSKFTDEQIEVLKTQGGRGGGGGGRRRGAQ
jgi:Spy/CpxP family protein refolding chaperone